jgi:hypothetical protein
LVHEGNCHPVACRRRLLEPRARLRQWRADDKEGALDAFDFLVQFNDRFCTEWAACNPDFACDIEGTMLPDSNCLFDQTAGYDCLNGEWTCDTSNTAFPVVQMPYECGLVYNNCEGHE